MALSGKGRGIGRMARIVMSAERIDSWGRSHEFRAMELIRLPAWRYKALELDKP
jgi:hypothetical protein